MPTKMSKDQLLKLENLPDGVLADLAALFQDIESRDADITKLRKEKGDADEVVKRAPELEKLSKDQAVKIDLLNTELAKYKIDPVSDDTDIYGFFKPFFQ